MIVGSLLLIVVAVGMLVLGLVQGVNALLVASIAASLLAAITLVVGGRQAAAARAEARSPRRSPRRPEATRDEDEGPARRAERQPVAVGVGAGSAGRPPLDDTSLVTPVPDEPLPLDDLATGLDTDTDLADDEEPADEPPAQHTTPADTARVARLTAEVVVVDGRPRYHLRGCVHLLGRDSEPLPVSEAVELGFTPCSVCEPDSSLLAAARRV
jgi:hypothetical protein